MSALLKDEIADFTRLRNGLIKGILNFADWLDQHNGIDAQRSLHLLEQVESLRRDKLMLAFVAEYSRGKTELINALFFADHGQRLLPSDAGRTTMCPTEIFFDAAQPPSIRLLPIETRLRDEPLAALKRQPIEWSTIALDPSSPDQMRNALRKLTEVRRATQQEAASLGLMQTGHTDGLVKSWPDGSVEIPCWRYALINFPHPLLEAGLTILDTPGLNALGTEPELTLASIPAAHAVFFVLATDTGVTRSDLEIWQRHVHRHVNYHVAVLNKIDTLWDDLRGELAYRTSLQKQMEETARVLKLPQEQIVAASAQKALIGRIRKDEELVARSGIAQLERLLSERIIPMRRELLYRGAVKQVATRISGERSALSARLREELQHIQQLSVLSGKNRELAAQLYENLLRDKSLYDASANRFKITRKVLLGHGDQVLEQLSQAGLHILLEEAKTELGESWTTRGLINGMRVITDRSIERFSNAGKLTEAMQKYLIDACDDLQRMYKLPRVTLTPLDLFGYRKRMHKLMLETEDFCRNPANLMLEKHFMIRRFYREVAAEATVIFEEASAEARRWLSMALDPVLGRIREFKIVLEERADSVRLADHNARDVHEQLERSKQRVESLRRKAAELDAIARLLVSG